MLFYYETISDSGCSFGVKCLYVRKCSFVTTNTSYMSSSAFIASYKWGGRDCPSVIYGNFNTAILDRIFVFFTFMKTYSINVVENTSSKNASLAVVL